MKHYAYHAPKRSTPEIRGTKCDNCRCMTVIERGKRIRITEYWCGQLHSVIDPHEVTCNYRKDTT